MSIRHLVRCAQPHYFTALCPICKRAHAHRVKCRKHNECPHCNHDSRAHLRKGYGPLIDDVFRAKSHRVFVVMVRHANTDPRIRLRRALVKLGCNGLVAADFDDQLLPLYRFVLIFDDDPELLEVKFRAARCLYFVKEAGNLSEIDRALDDLIPLRDRLTAYRVAEQHPNRARFCKVRPFGPLLRGRRVKTVHRRKLDEIKMCRNCECGDDIPVALDDGDVIEAAEASSLAQRLRHESPWARGAKQG